MSTIAMFTKHDGDPQQILFELQCIWYENEVGDAYSRLKMHGPALKKFGAVDKHFSDFIEDQFDFHAFSMRKVIKITAVYSLFFLLLLVMCLMFLCLSLLSPSLLSYHNLRLLFALTSI
jgi:hypothetical protein